MQEEEFFSHGHIKVTKARFIVADQTYAMSGITSVAKSKESPRHGLPVATVVIGILVAVVGAQNSAPGGIMLGVVFSLAGGAFMILRKPS